MKSISARLGLFFVSTLIAAACAPSMKTESPSVSGSGDDEIIGGQAVTSSDPIQKSIVGIRTYTQTLGLNAKKQMVPMEMVGTCTGTLISKNVVMTAGHCVVGIDNMDIFFGPTDAVIDNKVKSKVRTATRIVINASFNLQNAEAHDIALVQFAGTLPSGFAPATLLSDASILKNGMSVELAGYGVTSIAAAVTAVSNSSGHAAPLLTAPPAALLNQVAIPLENAQFNASEILFDESEGKGSCHGDSGGPAFLINNGKVTVIGVTSRGYDPGNSAAGETEAADCQDHIIYTNVSKYLDWINNKAIPELKTQKDGTLQAI